MNRVIANMVREYLMTEASSGIERCMCYLIDKIFNGIMVLLYGKNPSETKAQKLTRWLVVLIAIFGIIVAFFVIKTIFKTSAPGIGYIPE